MAARRLSWASRSSETARPGLPAASATRRSGWSRCRARGELLHLVARERREVERHGARADGGQQVVGVFGRHDEDEVRRRLLEGLEQGIGGLIVGAVHVIDQEDAPAALVGQVLGAVFEQAGLLDGDLAQRAVGREGDEIGVGGEQQRVLVALVGGPFLAGGDGLQVVRQAQVVLFDLLGVAQQARAQAAGQRGLPHALGTGEEQGLREALVRDHPLQRAGDVRVAPEVVKHRR